MAVLSPAEALRDGGDGLRGLLDAGLGGGGGCVRLCVLLEGGDGLEEGGAPLQLVSICGPFFVWKGSIEHHLILNEALDSTVTDAAEQ